MSETLVKFRCPACGGKISVDQEFYREVAGNSIECPHCQAQMMIPMNASAVTANGQKPEGAHGRNYTHKVQKPTIVQQLNKQRSTTMTSRTFDSDAAFCPNCKEEVGKRDRVCISCGVKLTPKDAGISLHGR